MRAAAVVWLAAALLAGCDRFQQKGPIPSYTSTTLESVRAANAEPPGQAASAAIASAPAR